MLDNNPNNKRNVIIIAQLRYLVTIFLTLFYLETFSFHSISQFLHNDSLELSNCLDSVRKYTNRDCKKAYSIAMDGLKRLNPRNNVIDKIKLLHATAYIEYYYKYDFNLSVIHLNEMRRLSDSIDFKRGKPWVELNMANIYYYQNDYPKSQELYNESIRDAELIGDSLIIVSALMGISDILFHYEYFDSALTYLHNTLNYTKRHNRLDMQFFILDDIANIYKRTGRLDSSYYYYQKTLDVSIKTGNSFAINCSKVNLAYVKYLKNKSFNAIPQLKELQKECKKNGFSRLYYEIGYTICEILEYKGDFENAYHLYKESSYIEDSITANKKIRKAAELESEYYLQKQEYENKELVRLNEINSLKLRNRKIFIFFTLFVLIQAIVLIYLIYKKYKTIKIQEKKILEQERLLFQKEKEAFEQKLHLQEREMTGKVMKIFHHNQLTIKSINDIKDIKRLVKMKDADNTAINTRLQHLINSLKVSSDKHMWVEFEKSFIETNPGYLEKLSAKFPDLTPNEIKLCIFLFLNLRTKEISIITQQTINSINIARTRLRKKLNLNNTNTSIAVFLKGINS